MNIEKMHTTLRCLRTLYTRQMVMVKGYYSVVNDFERSFLPQGNLTRDNETDRIVGFDTTPEEFGTLHGEAALAFSRMKAEKRFNTCLGTHHIRRHLFPSVTDKDLRHIIRLLDSKGIVSVWDKKADEYIESVARAADTASVGVKLESKYRDAAAGDFELDCLGWIKGFDKERPPIWNRNLVRYIHFDVDEMVAFDEETGKDPYGDLFDLDRILSKGE